MDRLRQRGEDVADLVPPAPLLGGGGEHVTDRLPEPERAVADGEHRRLHAATLAVAEQVSPRLARFAEPVGERDQLLAAVGADPDHHQQTHLVGLEPDLQVDAVDPHVHVVRPGQRPGRERDGLVLPLRGHPGDRGRRQALVGAQELGQRRPEIDWTTARADTAAATPPPPAGSSATRPAGSLRRTASAHRSPRRCACR